MKRLLIFVLALTCLRRLAIWLSVALGITLIVCIATNVSKSKKLKEQARK